MTYGRSEDKVRFPSNNKLYVLIYKWYHCDDKHITETGLLTLSNNVCLVFCAKEVGLGT